MWSASCTLGNTFSWKRLREFYLLWVMCDPEVYCRSSYALATLVYWAACELVHPGLVPVGLPFPVHSAPENWLEVYPSVHPFDSVKRPGD